MPPDDLKIVDDPYADARAAMEEIKAGAVQAETLAEKPNDPPADAVAKPDPVAADPAGDKDGDLKVDSKGRVHQKDGKFAKKEGEPEPQAQAKEPSADASKQPDKAPVAGATEVKGPEGAPQVGLPPPGWSVKSKTEWDKLPEHIRADIVKREAEVNQGFAKLQNYRGLDPYVEMAQRSGLTLDTALKNYTGMETALTRDPQNGLVQLAQTMGWSKEQAAQHFARVAHGLGYTGFAAPGHQNGTDPAQPAQNGAHQNGNGLPPEMHSMLAPVLTPLLQQVNELQSKLSRQEQADQERAAQTAAQAGAAFRADPANRYFANVEADIKRLLETGIVPLTGDHKADLQKAYDLACWQNPDVREALINQRMTKTTEDQAAKDRAVAAAAAKASRSVSGSPAPETRVQAPRKPGEVDDPYADARAALEEIRGRA